MAAYSVVAPPPFDPGAAGAERFRFVRDGFSWPAFILGPIWMLFHRLVLVLILWLVVLFGLGAAIRLLGVPSGTASLVFLLFALLIGLEASTLQCWTLKRRGWREIGIVVADELEAAERRFFDELHEQDPLDFGTSVAGRIAMLDRSQGGTDVIGLFPEPRGSR
ncbi:MAG: DUF2628 domain-containing protein [Xanthobacteraceae bacterium]|nr:DUF2628 domain-containing protein [Xanthobacteraceae bacterium]